MEVYFMAGHHHLEGALFLLHGGMSVQEEVCKPHGQHKSGIDFVPTQKPGVWGASSSALCCHGASSVAATGRVKHCRN